jgi:hypothetical protein
MLGPLKPDSMVALASFTQGEEREEMRFLSGRYWDVQDDLEEILGQQKEIETRDLYQLRIRRL